MKHLEIDTPQYKILEKKYMHWMDVWNKKPNTINAYAISLREFFNYCEKRDIRNVRLIEQKHVVNFIEHLKTRISHRDFRSGIRNSTINSIISGINCFVELFNQHNEHSTIDFTGAYLPADSEERVVLSKDEVMSLYEATYNEYRMGSIPMGQRDRVMIGLLYGCGLRMMEVLKLDLNDIDFSRSRVFVKGKKYKERYVPIPTRTLADIQTYIQDGRDWFKFHQSNLPLRRAPQKKYILTKDANALMLSMFGTRLASFQERIDVLVSMTPITKRVTSHVFRHSIATHHYIDGWPLEKIQKLLRHASIDTTQIYIHLAEQLKNEEQ